MSINFVVVILVVAVTVFRCSPFVIGLSVIGDLGFDSWTVSVAHSRSSHVGIIDSRKKIGDVWVFNESVDVDVVVEFIAEVNNEEMFRFDFLVAYIHGFKFGK